jgi:hypothetical protein
MVVARVFDIIIVRHTEHLVFGMGANNFNTLSCKPCADKA